MAQDTIDGQLDIFAVIDAADREDRAEDLPIHFATDPTLTPDDLETAFQVWIDRHGRRGCWPDSHMWHRAITGPYGTPGPHSAYAVTADLRCDHYWREPCLCPGDLVDRIYCADCQWWTGIHTHQSGPAIEYLGHCWPGWRDLPVLAESKPEKPIKIPKNYPEEWNTPEPPSSSMAAPTASPQSGGDPHSEATTSPSPRSTEQRQAKPKAKKERFGLPLG